MGVAIYDRNTGGWEDEFDESGKMKRRPAANNDRDTQVPIHEINDGGNIGPEININDNGRNLRIVPVAPEKDTDRKNNDDVIRESIIRKDKEEEN